ncbi:MAG: hypothetical protein ACE5LH_07865 [Fidelibacterota bacterium]
MSAAYIVLRSVQIMALLGVLSGLFWGIRDRNLILEIQALASGTLIFYLAHLGIRRWFK